MPVNVIDPWAAVGKPFEFAVIMPMLAVDPCAYVTDETYVDD